MKGRDKRRRNKKRKAGTRGSAGKAKVETYLLVDDLHHPAERFGQKEAR